MMAKKLFRALPGISLFAALTSSLLAFSAHSAEWRVPLRVSNGIGLCDTIFFGVHPEATAGIDGALGEVELPPWPPSSLYEVRFMIPGYEGLALDLRDTTHTQRTHTIKWQAGSGGYPVTVRWDRMSLPYGSFYISDGYGGVFLPPVNMYSVDSLLVPVSKSFITLLTLTVIPGVSPGADPEIGDIPDAAIYLGQQFPEYRLDEYVFDPDTPDSLIDWFITGNEALVCEVRANRFLHILAPEGWRGQETVTITARDPEHHTDQASVVFSVIPGGRPSWSIPIVIRNAASEGRTVWFGIHPDGTEAIDLELGEVGLPPWPPQAAFDARLQLPDDVTFSAKDIRRSAQGQITYHLKWQPGEGGYPVTVSWPSELPLGQFSVLDDMGGVFIPPTDMSATSQVEIPPEMSSVTGLLINAEAVVDTIPPLGPRFLEWTGDSPDLVYLAWDACVEEHFSYYEILYDTAYFEAAAPFVWDWTEDTALTHRETVSATIALPWAEAHYAIRIRAWDTFGNVGALSSPVVVAVPEEQRSPRMPVLDLSSWPNPFQSGTSLQYSIEANKSANVTIYDIAGRRIASLAVEPSPSGRGIVFWDGRDQKGHKASSGVYFCRLEARGTSVSRKILLLK